MDGLLRRAALVSVVATLVACGSESGGSTVVLADGANRDAASDAKADVSAAGIGDAGGDGARPDAGTIDTGVPVADAGPACVIDGFAWKATEYKVVAKGKMWTLDGTRALVGSAAGTDLRAMDGFKNGPCVGQGPACRLDGLAWNADNSVYYAMVGTKYWHLDATFALTGPGAAGALLDDVASFAAGPCVGQTKGTCHFESIAWQDTVGLFVTNVGKAWAYNGAGTLIGSASGTALTSFAGLVQMCSAVGGTCPVDDLTWRHDVKQFQYIAGGRYWATDETAQAVAGSGADLRSIAGFAAGPCAP